MKKEDIKKSFANVEPGEMATKRMLKNVLNHRDSKKVTSARGFNFKKMVPAVAMVALLAFAVLSFDLVSKSNIGYPSTDRADENDLASGDTRENMPRDSIGREDMAIEIRNQFRIGNRHYILLSEWEREQLNLSKTITSADIGEKIATITDSIDGELKGLNVYKFLPTGGEVIVAVRRNDVYELFRFFSFESYQYNKDEDMITYLHLYGIHSPADISKIQFIGQNEASKIRGQINIIVEITDMANIEEFFNLFSVLKDSSDKFFEKIYNYRKRIQEIPSDPKDLPSDPRRSGAIEPGKPGAAEGSEPILGILPAPDSDDPVDDSDQDQEAIFDRGGPGQWTEPSEGTIDNALFDAIIIRIYNQQGMPFETVYYPNMGFISRHQVSKELEVFLRNMQILH